MTKLPLIEKVSLGVTTKDFYLTGAEQEELVDKNTCVALYGVILSDDCDSGLGVLISFEHGTGKFEVVDYNLIKAI